MLNALRGRVHRMTSLSAASVAALARLRSFRPPASVWSSLPLSRRAAVLILLYADTHGELRVVLTMRANTLSSFPGQVALPGGKTDSISETAFQTARREADEEIGLPRIDSWLPAPFRIEQLCELPSHLARNELGVRPCVAFLHFGSSPTYKGAPVDPQGTLVPKLDPHEVAAVFSAPFQAFLQKDYDTKLNSNVPIPQDGLDWYEGNWIQWHDLNWRMHSFNVPIKGNTISRPRLPRKRNEAIIELNKSEEAGLFTRYKVWGLTARILVDAARLAYDVSPEFEHGTEFGDEELIGRLIQDGTMSEAKEAKWPGLPTKPPSPSRL